MKLEFSLQIFEKILNMIFREDSSNGAELFPANRRTERHNEANSGF